MLRRCTDYRFFAIHVKLKADLFSFFLSIRLHHCVNFVICSDAYFISDFVSISSDFHGCVKHKSNNYLFLCMSI